MPLPTTSKDKSARIDWGYFDRPSRLNRVRGWLWVLAALLIVTPLAAATLAAALTGSPPAPLAAAASPGPLAAPHAAWDNRCEACHVPFSPIGTDRRTGHEPGDHSHNSRCETCHAAPPHHPAEKPGTVAGCADCHRDHRGRDASLVRLADSTCVRCHGNLPDHHANPAAIATVAQVNSFARVDGHPEFRAVGPDRIPARTLKFSHATHMAPGMGLGRPFTFGSIVDESERRRYQSLLGSNEAGDVVRLDCAACHQLETGGSYRPINFEAHCRACHPLTFDESADLRHLQAPHRVQPDEIDRFLRRLYTERFVAGELKAAREPDRGHGRLDPPPAAVAAARGKIEAAVTAAKQTLLIGRTTCLECHFATGPAAVALGQDPRLPDAIVRPAPVRWMPAARFDHQSHRALDCRHCHERAYQGRTDVPTDYQHPPDLPSAATCRQCHSPAGGVRHGCTDCHSYHHVRPGQGTPDRRFPTAEDWLRARHP